MSPTRLSVLYPLSGIVDSHWPELRKSSRSRMESDNFIHQDSPTLDHVNSSIHLPDSQFNPSTRTIAHRRGECL